MLFVLQSICFMVSALLVTNLINICYICCNGEYFKATNTASMRFSEQWSTQTWLQRIPPLVASIYYCPAPRSVSYFPPRGHRPAPCKRSVEASANVEATRSTSGSCMTELITLLSLGPNYQASASWLNPNKARSARRKAGSHSCCQKGSVPSPSPSNLICAEGLRARKIAGALVLSKTYEWCVAAVKCCLARTGAAHVAPSCSISVTTVEPCICPCIKAETTKQCACLACTDF